MITDVPHGWWCSIWIIVVSGAIDRRVFLIPLYLDLDVRLAEGLRNENTSDFTNLLNMYSKAVGSIDYSAYTGLNGNCHTANRLRQLIDWVNDWLTDWLIDWLIMDDEKMTSMTKRRRRSKRRNTRRKIKKRRRTARRRRRNKRTQEVKVILVMLMRRRMSIHSTHESTNLGSWRTVSKSFIPCYKTHWKFYSCQHFDRPVN